MAQVFAPILAAGVADLHHALPVDFHMHTTYSDGAVSPRQMVEAAVAAGLTTIGVADHGHMALNEDYFMAADAYDGYRAELAALQAEFADRIAVYCGVEQDYFCDVPTDGFDYCVGSVHYVRVPGTAPDQVVQPGNPDGEYLAIDDTPEIMRLGIDRYFGGDAYALAEAYYELVADVVNRTGCSIIGHFDLVKIWNGIAEDGTPGTAFFDENHPRYVAAWQRAADALLTTGVPFEINMNAVAKGRCAEAYPSLAIVGYLAERGARFVVSSDAHKPEALCAPTARPELAPYLA